MVSVDELVSVVHGYAGSGQEQGQSYDSKEHSLTRNPYSFDKWSEFQEQMLLPHNANLASDLFADMEKLHQTMGREVGVDDAFEKVVKVIQAGLADIENGGFGNLAISLQIQEGDCDYHYGNRTMPSVVHFEYQSKDNKWSFDMEIFVQSSLYATGNLNAYSDDEIKEMLPNLLNKDAVHDYLMFARNSKYDLFKNIEINKITIKNNENQDVVLVGDDARFIQDKINQEVNLSAEYQWLFRQHGAAYHPESQPKKSFINDYWHFNINKQLNCNIGNHIPVENIDIQANLVDFHGDVLNDAAVNVEDIGLHFDKDSSTWQYSPNNQNINSLSMSR